MTGCTTCPFPEGFLPYSPSTAGNAFLLAAFAALVPASLFLGYRHPALGFTLNFVTALCLEVLGFAGRLLLHGDGESKTFFTLYLLGSVLGTTAFASAVFAVLPHVLGVYSANSRRGARVAVGFGGLLVVIVVLEIVGIAFAVFGIGGAVVSSFWRDFCSFRVIGSNVNHVERSGVSGRAGDPDGRPHPLRHNPPLARPGPQVQRQRRPATRLRTPIPHIQALPPR